MVKGCSFQFCPALSFPSLSCPALSYSTNPVLPSLNSPILAQFFFLSLSLFGLADAAGPFPPLLSTHPTQTPSKLTPSYQHKPHPNHTTPHTLYCPAPPLSLPTQSTQCFHTPPFTHCPNPILPKPFLTPPNLLYISTASSTTLYHILSKTFSNPSLQYLIHSDPLTYCHSLHHSVPLSSPQTNHTLHCDTHHTTQSSPHPTKGCIPHPVYVPFIPTQHPTCMYP